MKSPCREDTATFLTEKKCIDALVNQKKALPLQPIFERGNIMSNLLIKTNKQF